MKMSRFLAIIGLVTIFSLLYVYQQTEIIHLAYAGQDKRIVFDDLLDKNSLLRYNINKSASLVRIAGRISGGTDFQMPDTYKIVRVTSSRNGLLIARRQVKKENLLSRLFGVKRQAEAKTITP